MIPLDELKISTEDFDVPVLLAHWAWRVPHHLQPLFLSTFGDWFFRDADDHVHMFDLVAGDLLAAGFIGAVLDGDALACKDLDCAGLDCSGLDWDLAEAALPAVLTDLSALAMSFKLPRVRPEFKTIRL